MPMSCAAVFETPARNHPASTNYQAVAGKIVDGGEALYLINLDTDMVAAFAYDATNRRLKVLAVDVHEGQLGAGPGEGGTCWIIGGL